MSPPDVNLDKQRRRHGAVIWGFVIAFLIAIAAWITLIGVTDDVDATRPLNQEAEETAGAD